MVWRERPRHLTLPIPSTTVTTVAMLTSGASLGILATLLLISLLGAKEVVTADPIDAVNAKRISAFSFSKNLNIAILPLLFTFVLIVAFKIIEVTA
ncbi:MAG: hypothetical protein NWE98_00630 [Candidatus Bathyarchaeota archaeon]|nr:hypothetical protein [Candidatus Bathyarchaeota archaeon]